MPSALGNSDDWVAYRGRDCDIPLTLLDSTGAAIQLATADLVKVRIGRLNAATPDLSFDSATPTTNGSTVLKQVGENLATVRLASADVTALALDCYSIEVGVVVAADSNRFKLSYEGVLTIVGSLG